jgi:hypothetical protein
MIRGYFLTKGASRRPFVKAILQFPTLDDGSLEVELLVDTGADRTILAPIDVLRLARRFRLDPTSLPVGIPSTGVGGRAVTRTLEAAVILDGFRSPTFPLTLLEPPPGPTPPVPSLLGRDLLSRFALFLEERTRRVLLLTPHEVDDLPLSL